MRERDVIGGLSFARARLLLARAETGTRSVTEQALERAEATLDQICAMPEIDRKAIIDVLRGNGMRKGKLPTKELLDVPASPRRARTRTMQPEDLRKRAQKAIDTEKDKDKRREIIRQFVKVFGCRPACRAVSA